MGVEGRVKKPITKREAQVIKSLADGATARQIATVLHVSPHTVRTHIRNIYDKLGVSNRVELLWWDLNQRIHSSGAECYTPLDGTTLPFLAHRS